MALRLTQSQSLTHPPGPYFCASSGRSHTARSGITCTGLGVAVGDGAVLALAVDSSGGAEIATAMRGAASSALSSRAWRCILRAVAAIAGASWQSVLM